MQELRVEGQRNIAIQAKGDDIRISVNDVHITLSRRQNLRRAPRTELDLLNPNVRAIEFRGRDAQLNDLLAWLSDGRPVSARCLIGRAGSGKTRLALQLCEAADELGWIAGFLTHQELVRFHGRQNLADWDWPKPMLVVVDYAAASARPLRDWLVELAQNPGDPERPFRLLLLERHADPQFGWWPELIRAEGWSDAGVAELFDPSVPIPLPSITDLDARRGLLKDVMLAASALARQPPLRPPPLGQDAEFDRRLAATELTHEPLYLLMAGLTAVHHGVPHVLTLGRVDLAQHLAGLELGRIGRLAEGRGLHPAFLRHLAACVTLQGGCGRNGFEDGDCRGAGGAAP